MFLGEYTTRFTGKGRVILPKKIRDSIFDSVVILSRGFEGCVLGFSLADWEREAGKQLESSITENKGRNLRRFFFSSSENLGLDIQGRIVIPLHLVEYACLRDEIVIIGAGDHFEIWDKDRWQLQIKTIEKDISNDDSNDI